MKKEGRRKFLSTTCSVTAIALTGCVDETTGGFPTTNISDVDISIFWEKELEDILGEDLINDSVDMMYDAVEYSFNTIPEGDESLSINISSPNDRMVIENIEPQNPEDEQHNQIYDSAEVRSEFESKLESEIDSFVRARDCNILITSHDMDVSGRAMIPNTCEASHDMDVAVMNFPMPVQFDGFDESAITSNRDYVESVTNPNRILSTLIHEIGHTVGMTHEMGTIEIEDERPLVSPMLSGYAFDDNYVNQKNAFGEEITDPDEFNRSPKIMPEFNPKITTEDIHIGNSC